MTLDSFWDLVRMTFRIMFWDEFGGSCWGRFGMTLWSFWDGFGISLGCMFGHCLIINCGMILGLFRDDFEIILI